LPMMPTDALMPVIHILDACDVLNSLCCFDLALSLSF
jgi:hypothetical protein